MTGFFMFLHGIVSLILIVTVLMQSGRGGGLTEGFASAESIFGAQTNEFMIKATTVIAGLFLLTCLGLAVISSQKGKSLMSESVVTDSVIPLPAETQTPEGESSDDPALPLSGSIDVDAMPEAVEDLSGDQNDALDSSIEAVFKDIPAEVPVE